MRATNKTTEPLYFSYQQVKRRQQCAMLSLHSLYTYRIHRAYSWSVSFIYKHARSFTHSFSFTFTFTYPCTTAVQHPQSTFTHTNVALPMKWNHCSQDTRISKIWDRTRAAQTEREARALGTNTCIKLEQTVRFFPFIVVFFFHFQSICSIFSVALFRLMEQH